MLTSTDAFQLQVIDKIKSFALIKPILTTKVKVSNKIKKIQHNEMIIQKHIKELVKNVDNIDINNTIYLHDYIAHYYQKKEDVKFVLTTETKFINPGYWKRVHKHIIGSTSLPNNGCKYNICQEKDDNESSKYIDAKTSEVFVKESRFSYIRPVDGATRLIVYNINQMLQVWKK